MVPKTPSTPVRQSSGIARIPSCTTKLFTKQQSSRLTSTISAMVGESGDRVGSGTETMYLWGSTSQPDILHQAVELSFRMGEFGEMDV
tara:strand:- start:1762 stop:2025 length:264 start_codon:yes stop_codon:yes gene_type:complete